MSVNNGPVASDPSQQKAPPIDEGLRSGLTLLWQANRYAADARMDQWDFALEIDKLYELGLTVSDLRWLVAKGYVEHAQETSNLGDAHRSFRPSNGLSFVPATCFVLTAKGAEFASAVQSESPATSDS